MNAPALTASIDPCADGEDVCEAAFRVTGDSTAAELAGLLIGTPLAIAGLLVLGFALRWVLHRAIGRLVRRAEGGVLTAPASRFSLLRRRMTATPTPAADLARATRRVQRAKAIGDLVKSIITGVLTAVIGTMILSELGVDIAPIIASAGIIGIALGFGAQSLVKDFLSGLFMIIEDQYGVGDVIDVGEATGTVEAVSLRVTQLRDVNGTVWYVPNGEIVRVGNMSQNWARTVLDVTVAYSEDLAKVRRVLQEVAHDLWEDEDYRGVIVEEPEVWGVEDLGVDGVKVRVTLKTAPLEQWAVARELRQRIKARFDYEGIEIPFPQRVVWNRDPTDDRADLTTPATPRG